MKKLILLTIAVTMLSFQGLKAQTNDFYDDAETIKLKTTGIELLGEIANPGKINVGTLPLRSVIVKETSGASVGSTTFLDMVSFSKFFVSGSTSFT